LSIPGQRNRHTWQFVLHIKGSPGFRGVHHALAGGVQLGPDLRLEEATALRGGAGEFLEFFLNRIVAGNGSARAAGRRSGQLGLAAARQAAGSDQQYGNSFVHDVFHFMRWSRR
jgi:hypothetical protein